MCFGKKALSVVLCLVILFGGLAIGRDGFAGVLDSISIKASTEGYSWGDIIEYGTYPQSDVTASMGKVTIEP